MNVDLPVPALTREKLSIGMATVLVVEDDPGVLELVALILSQNGYEVLRASNGLEGLMIYTSYRGKLDLVLTDVNMPQMNGIELAARIHSLDPTTKVILMSGTLDGSTAPEESPLLVKPFLPQQLMAVVEGVLST